MKVRKLRRGYSYKKDGKTVRVKRHRQGYNIGGKKKFSRKFNRSAEEGDYVQSFDEQGNLVFVKDRDRVKTLKEIQNKAEREEKKEIFLQRMAEGRELSKGEKLFYPIMVNEINSRINYLESRGPNITGAERKELNVLEDRLNKSKEENRQILDEEGRVQFLPRGVQYSGSEGKPAKLFTKSSRGINLRDYQLAQGKKELEREQKSREKYGKPKSIKFKDLPKSIQRDIEDDEFNEDMDSYNLLVSKGEDPVFLRESLRKRGAKL